MYFYDPESFDFWGVVRSHADQEFMPVMAINVPWVSPLLGIRFELFDTGLEVFYPNGDRFQDPEEVFLEREQLQQERNQAQAERDQAFAKLRELGIDPSQL